MLNQPIQKLVVGVLATALALLAIYSTGRTVISPVQFSQAASLTPTITQVKSALTIRSTPRPTAKPPLSPLQPTATALSRSPVALPAPIISYTYQVVKTYPHDPTAWTEGLFFDNGVLYEGTGEIGQSFLRKIDLATGKVLQQLKLADPYYGEGIVSFGDKLYQLTYQNQIGFVYNKATFKLLKTFTYPTEGWGFTQDGRHLIMSDGSARLTYRDPATLAVTGHIDVSAMGGPVTQLNELEYIKGEIYANIWTTNQIVIIAPQTGKVTGLIDLTNLLPPADQGPNQWLNGIAYLPKGDRLFVTGKHWPKLFEIRLIPTVTTP